MVKRVSSDDKIKAVIFDVVGVLNIGGKKRKTRGQTHVSGVHEILANKLGLTMDQYFDSIDSAYAKSIEGKISKSVLTGILACNLNYPKEKIETLFHKAYKKKYRLNKELIKIAKSLQKQGYKVGILSDQWHFSKDVLIPKKELSFIKKKIVSCDVGMRKPHKEIYKLALEKLGVKAHEAVFIDDQEWNIVPAHKLGLNTILFIDNKKTKEQLKHFGIKVK